MIKEKFINNVGIVNLLSALALVLTLPFYYSKSQFYATLIFFVSYIIEFILTKKWGNFKFDKKQWVFIVMAFYFLLQIFYYPFEKDLTFFQKILEQRLPFIAFAIIGLFGFNKYFKLRYFAFIFILTSFAIISYLIFFKIGFLEFISNNSRAQLFADARILYVHGHMIFNSFLNLTLIFVFYLVFVLKKYTYSSILNPLVIISGIYIFGILSISDGRTGFLVAILMLLLMIFYKLWSWKRYLAIFIGSISLVCVVFVIMHHPRINKDKIIHEPRFAIWHVAEKVISKQPYAGYGASTAASVFMTTGANDSEFIEAGDVYLLKMMSERNILGGNPHNIFLKSELEYGILGVLVILLFFFIPLVFVAKHLRFCMALFIFSVVFQLMFEIFMSGISALMFTMIIALFIRVDDTENQDLIDN